MVAQIKEAKTSKFSPGHGILAYKAINIYFYIDNLYLRIWNLCLYFIYIHIYGYVHMHIQSHIFTYVSLGNT